MTRQPDPAQATTDLAAARAKLRRVPCPQPPRGCGQPIGRDCVRTRTGSGRAGLGCWRRVQAHDTAYPADAHPALPTDPEPAPPGRRLVPAEQLRRDLVRYIHACGWCHHSIVLPTDPSGATLPLDARPGPDGTVLLTVDERGPRAFPLKPTQLDAARADGRSLHTPHRDTCPCSTRPRWLVDILTARR